MLYWSFPNEVAGWTRFSHQMPVKSRPKSSFRWRSRESSVDIIWCIRHRCMVAYRVREIFKIISNKYNIISFEDLYMSCISARSTFG